MYLMTILSSYSGSGSATELRFPLDPDPQHWLKARLLGARRLTGSSKPAAAEAWPEKRDSVLEVIGGHLAKFRPSHVDYPQLDHLTDMDLRAFTAQRRVRLRERMPRKRVTTVLIFGDFALQSIDAAFLQALGKRVYIIRSACMFKDVYVQFEISKSLLAVNFDCLQ
jgi:hypothetical protein